MRGTPTITAMTTATIASARSVSDDETLLTASMAITIVRSPGGLGTSSANGTCCNAMIVAIPTVKPSTTGHGM